MKNFIDKNGFTWTSFTQFDTRYSLQYRKHMKEIEKWSRYNRARRLADEEATLAYADTKIAR